MPPIRFRMNRLMGWIGVIALNLAALRMLIVGRDMVLPIVGVILGGLFQFALYRAFRRPVRARSFWFGFASSGTIATISLFWAARHDQSIADRIWNPYYSSLVELLEATVGPITPIMGNRELAFVVLIALGCILPIVLVAFAVSLTASRFAADPGRRIQPSAGPPVH